MSSSDPLKAKRFVELRKKKLKQALLEVKPRPVVQQEENHLQQQNEGDDSIISASGGGGGGGGPRPLMAYIKAMPLTLKQKAAIHANRQHQQQQQQQQQQNQDDQTIDPSIIILESSSSMSSLGVPPPPPDIPSTLIRNRFAASSSVTTLSEGEEYDEDGSRSSASITTQNEKSETGRNQLQRAIEERAEKASKVLGHGGDNDSDNDENNNNGSPFQKKKDLRSIYQQYLDGNVEKESVVRSGKQWTKGYRTNRRIQYCPRSSRTPFQETTQQQEQQQQTS
jgi:hypothetical protein